MAIPTLNNYAMPSQWKANKVNWTLNPKRAALLIHDMQEYFTAFYGEDSPLIQALTERLAAVREVSQRVFAISQGTLTASPGKVQRRSK